MSRHGTTDIARTAYARRMASATQILRAWEARWGKLYDELRERFLERSEVDDLQEFSVRVVQEAVGRHKLLKDALGEARVLGHWTPPAAKPWNGGAMIRNPVTGRGG